MAETSNAPVAPAARKRAPVKAAPKKTTPAATPANEVSATNLILEPDGATKSYAKFRFPEGSGCVGTVYAKLGTKVVKVRLEF